MKAFEKVLEFRLKADIERYIKDAGYFAWDEIRDIELDGDPDQAIITITSMAGSKAYMPVSITRDGIKSRALGA